MSIYRTIGYKSQRPLFEDAYRQMDGRGEMSIACEDISDGYHTFHELYTHRRALFVALTKFVTAAQEDAVSHLSGWVPTKLIRENGPWRSQLHHDGTMFEGGYFVVGFLTQNGQVTYHYKMEHWAEFDHCRTLERAPEYDGSTPADVVERLLKL